MSYMLSATQADSELFPLNLEVILLFETLPS